MSRPKLLDLFCCQGGASMGYYRAGFDVYGVDLFRHKLGGRLVGVSQRQYPFPSIQGDAVDFLDRVVGTKAAPLYARFSNLETVGLHEFDAIHASPPCQAFTNAQKIRGNKHPDLIEPVRELLLQLGKPYVIENVPGAPLKNPFELCGAMFGLQTYRHRLFETNFDVPVPEHPEHTAKTTKMGRPPKPGEFMHVVGNFSGVQQAREVMGMPWATRDGLREAIPPAYTEHIGKVLLATLKEQAA